MKNLSLVLSVLAILGVGALWLGTPPLLRGFDQAVDTQYLFGGLVVGPDGQTARANSFIKEVHCTSVPKTFPTIAVNATSTFGIAFTGAATSSRQVYILSATTSTSGAANPIEGLTLSGVVSSTADSLQITAKPEGVGLVEAALTINACYIEFTTSTAAVYL